MIYTVTGIYLCMYSCHVHNTSQTHPSSDPCRKSAFNELLACTSDIARVLIQPHNQLCIFHVYVYVTIHSGCTEHTHRHAHMYNHTHHLLPPPHEHAHRGNSAAGRVHEHFRHRVLIQPHNQLCIMYSATHK